MNQRIFTPIGMDYFMEDMIIPCDIFESSGPLLIAHKDMKIDKNVMDNLERHHNESGLLVYKLNYHLISAQKKENEIIKKNKRKEALENETGFTEIKGETLTLLEEITKTKVIHSNRVRMVSAEISYRLEVEKPDSIVSLVNMLASVDEYLHRHSTNVSMLNGLIGRWLGLARKDIDTLITVGLTHDCGKALIPLKILNYPRPLSRAEFEVIKMHSIHSYNLLTEFPETVRFGARAHHEKLNGKGYPDMFGKDKLTLMARVTAVSDIYDAMVSRRAYKDARSPFQIMVIIREMMGIDLDPYVVDVFTKHMSQELIGKPALMNNGEIGIIHSIDHDDLEYPYVTIGSNVVKTNAELSCMSMEF